MVVVVKVCIYIYMWLHRLLGVDSGSGGEGMYIYIYMWLHRLLGVDSGSDGEGIYIYIYVVTSTAGC